MIPIFQKSHVVRSVLIFLWCVFLLGRVSLILVVFLSACDFTSNKSLIINYLCVTGTSFTSLSLVNSLTGYEPKLGIENPFAPPPIMAGRNRPPETRGYVIAKDLKAAGPLVPQLQEAGYVKWAAGFADCQRINKAKASKASPCHTEVVYN